jgi:hypothetical protein
MSSELDAVEERLKRLEKYVLGEDVHRQDDEQVLRNSHFYGLLLLLSNSYLS